MKVNTELVLASASPRRRDLLASVGILCHVVPSTVSEEPVDGETPQNHVLRLSIAKAVDVAAKQDVPGRWFLGSDTIVVRDTELLGKPRDRAEAFAMLRSLAGRAHQVLSGYAVHDRISGETRSGAVVTEVIFRQLSDAEIAGYLDTGEPFDKAGAYAVQGIGAFMVRAVHGSYTNVVGLPLCEVVEVLEKMGAARLFAAFSAEKAGSLQPLNET
ncbi:MAG: septum formation inhibitor Maf [Desulfuromonadaceae bacterium]|nr:septum formation inhibitor Maf [Desulfuromonadaceae bacterium]